MKLSADQFTRSTALLSRITNFSAFEVSGNVGQLGAIAGSTRVQSLEVVDSNVNIQNNLAGLSALGDKLKTVRFSTPANTLQLSAADYLGTHASSVAKLPANATLQITGATVGQVETLANDRRVRGISVTDSARNVQEGIAVLNKHARRIATVSNWTGDANEQLSFNASELRQNKPILNKLVSGFELSLMAGSVTEFNRLRSDRLVEVVQVQDTSANISRHLRSLHGTRQVGSIQITDAQNPLRISHDDALATLDTLYRITTPAQISFTNTNVTMDQFVSINKALEPPYFNPHHRLRLVDVNIADSSARINSTPYAELKGAASSIRAINVLDSNPVAVDFNDAELLSKFSTNTVLTGRPENLVHFSSVAQFQDAAQNYRLKDVMVQTTSAEFASNFSIFSTNKSLIQGVTFTGVGAQREVAIPQADIVQHVDLIKKLRGDISIVASDAPRLVRDGRFLVAAEMGGTSSAWYWNSDEGVVGRLGETRKASLSRAGAGIDPVEYFEQHLGVLRRDFNDITPHRYMLSFNVEAPYSSFYYGIRTGSQTTDAAISRGYASFDAAGQSGMRRFNFEMSIGPDANGESMFLFLRTEPQVLVRILF